MTSIDGLGVSAGRVVGPLVHMPGSIAEPPSEASLADGTSPEPEAQRIEEAAEAVAAALRETAEQASGDAQSVLEATAMMAADPTLVEAAQTKVREGGASAPRAVWDAAEEVSAQLADLGGYMAERAGDVRDVRDRLIARLTGRQPPGVPRRDEPFVLAARDLAPADTATLDPAGVLALVTAEGGPTSHTAILSRALGLPAVVGAPGVLDIAEGTVVLVDGSSGQVVTDPSDDEIAAVREERARESVFDGTGATADGHRVALLANVGDPRDIDAAVEANAEGVGLFRTEFCFLERTEPPTVEEQVTAYRRVLTAFAGKKVVVRTLDAGADKPLPFLAATDEPNPALGVRGYRTTTRSPEIVDDQLAALAQAAQAEEADVWVMAPMIATPQEAEEFVARARSHDLPMAGVMVEVPSAAVCADDVLAHAQFASIGTNDLAQYALAADRTLGEVAVLNDPWQPALLRLIRMTCSAAGERDRPVGVCGEAAADPALACVLVGMGITSLSMTPRAIAAVAAALNRVSREDCARLAQIALRARGPEEARRAVRAELEAR